MMPIPYVPGDASMEKVYEENFSFRIALTKIQEAFIANGYNTVNFEAKYRKAKLDDLFRGLDNNFGQKEKLINYAAPDIYIETELNYLKEERAGDGDKVQIRLNAYLTATSSFLGGAFCETNRFRNVDIGQLTNRAIKDCFDDFIQSLQSGFNDLIEYGQPIQLEISIKESAPFSFNSELRSSDGMSDYSSFGNLLEIWFEEQAQSVQIRGNTKRMLIYNEIRLPFFDEDGNYYSVSKFKKKLERYFRKFRLIDQPDHEISLEEAKIGNTLYLKIF